MLKGNDAVTGAPIGAVIFVSVGMSRLKRVVGIHASAADKIALHTTLESMPCGLSQRGALAMSLYLRSLVGRCFLLVACVGGFSVGFVASALAAAAPIDAAAAQFAAGADIREASAGFSGMLPDLRAAEATTPGLALGNLAGEMSADGMTAVLDEAKALDDLQAASESGNPRKASITVLPEVMRPMFDLARSGPDSALGLYALGLAVSEAEGEGLTEADILGPRPDPADLVTFTKAMKAEEANPVAASLQRTSLKNAETFLIQVSGFVPKGLAPGLSSPTGVFFKDLINWDDDMWSSSTDALSLVSDAIQTGKLNLAAFDKISRHLEALGRQGPWSKQSGIDFLRRLTAGVPRVGRFLPPLWSALAGSTLAIHQAIPIVTALAGQLPPQSFSFDLGGGATATLTASPGYHVWSDGSVDVGLVKIVSDALPPYLHTDAPANSGEEAHRWLVYPEQQVVAVTVDYDTGSVVAPGSVGAFNVQAMAPVAATRVIGLEVAFAPLGKVIVLHWPADIAIK
jgi:hypothetical protein